MVNPFIPIIICFISGSIGLSVGNSTALHVSSILGGGSAISEIWLGYIPAVCIPYFPLLLSSRSGTLVERHKSHDPLKHLEAGYFDYGFGLSHSMPPSSASLATQASHKSRSPHPIGFYLRLLLHVSWSRNVTESTRGVYKFKRNSVRTVTRICKGTSACGFLEQKVQRRKGGERIHTRGRVSWIMINDGLRYLVPPGVATSLVRRLVGSREL